MVYFLPSETDRYFLSPVSTQRSNVFVLDVWPAPATYHRSFCERCDQRAGRSPNERALFRFHGAVVGFVDGCLSRTRNLTASNQHLAEFFLGRSWLKRPRSCFFGFFEKFEKKMKICTHSERNRNLLARIFEIRVSIGTGLSVFLGCRN